MWLPKALILELFEMGLMEGCGFTADSVTEAGRDVYIRSVCLTFGAKRSVPIFTLLARQVLRVWRSRGWPVAHLLERALSDV